MNRSILLEIPEFLIDSIIFCDNLIHKNQKKSCLVLTKCLKFYEFRRKQCLNSIDLSETCLAELKQNFLEYDGLKCKWYEKTEATAKESTVAIGKYIYNHFEVSKLYVLLSCWNKLIVLQRLNVANDSGFQLEAEFGNVASFKIVKNPTLKYQAALKVEFENSSTICTDFQQHDSDSEVARNTNPQTEQRREFKQMHERVRTAKAELQLHKEITQRQFESLRSRQGFGNNFLRSFKLEEKPLLSRCGDVWIRITSQDAIVVGVPLVNNCAPPNLTIFKNLCPVLLVGRPTTPPCTTCDVIQYEHRIYQLQQTFDNLETLETFFQTEDIKFQQNSWVANDNDDVRPLSFVVLVLKFLLPELVVIDEQCQLFVRFDVEKDLETLIPKTQIFQQHLHIKALDFQEILNQRLQHEIVFNEKTLQQDFLAVAITSFSTQLQIDFIALLDLHNFEDLLAKKFDFDIVHRDTKSVNKDEMDVDGLWNEETTSPSLLFYNRKSSSLWFGGLALRSTTKAENNEDSSLQTQWSFYLPNEEKTFLMFKLLFSELLTLKCNIVDVRHGNQIESNESKVVNFEHRMRQELKTYLDLLKNIADSAVINEKIELLMTHQLLTDLFIAND